MLISALEGFQLLQIVSTALLPSYLQCFLSPLPLRLRLVNPGTEFKPVKRGS